MKCYTCDNDYDSRTFVVLDRTGVPVRGHILRSKPEILLFSESGAIGMVGDMGPGYTYRLATHAEYEYPYSDQDHATPAQQTARDRMLDRIADEHGVYPSESGMQAIMHELGLDEDGDPQA